MVKKVHFDDNVIVNEIPNENKGRKFIRRSSNNNLKMKISSDLYLLYYLVLNDVKGE
mgnify:CR=1 FL=1